MSTMIIAIRTTHIGNVHAPALSLPWSPLLDHHWGPSDPTREWLWLRDLRLR